MSILKLWKASPDLLAEKTAKQIIAIAGDGKLTEAGETSQEFRAFLSEVPSGLLAKYASNCLEEAFTDSGLVLQDIVNEMGSRLGMAVDPGRYRGRPGVVGNDGLWSLPSGHQIVVEVKTTDAYRIDLNVIAGYRTEMIRLDKATEANSSVLIVVGRIDTGDLEAQIRGSRFAWSMRLLSVDALIHLVELKETLEDPESLKRIHQILVPREFTKLDEIVDLVFSTAEDAKGSEIAVSSNDEMSAKPLAAAVGAPKLTPVAFNDACAALVSQKLGVPLLKRSRASYSTPDGALRVVCAVSKTYEETKKNYWFAFHPHQRDNLLNAKAGYVAFGCGSPALTVLIPIQEFSDWLEGMNTTIKDDRAYWHVQIFEEDNKLVLVRRKGQPKIILDKYRVLA